MKTLIAFLLLVGAVSLSAQTKRIAHRSHSGADSSMTLVGEGNFGLGPERYYYVAPDTAEAVDSAGFFPSAVIPDPPMLPASPILQPTPVEPDTTNNATSPSGTVPAPTPAGPNVTVRNVEPTASPTDQAFAPASPGPGDRSGEKGNNRLGWLALFLALPAAGVVLYGMGKNYEG